MAENRLIIGSLPVLRGAYDSAINYYRDNQVTMYGSTFQSLADDNIGFPPAELREDGKVHAINTDKWIIVANAIDAYNAGERIANAETRIKELGEYADSPEFIRTYTDAEGKFLWGIRADGTVEWAKGVPTPVKEALRELESKINTDNNGKFEEIETSLVALQDAVDVINASLKPLTDTFSFQDSPEFVNVVTDADGKVLFGLTAEGKPYFPKNTMYSVESNQEFLAAWLDSAGHVLFGLRTDGSTYVAKADFLTKIEEILKLLDENSIKDEDIAAQVKQLQDTFSIVSNDEWLHAVVDAEGKLLFGIKAENGEVVMPKQDTYKVIRNDEWLAAWLDSQDRILFGVKADGTFWAAKSNFAGDNYDEQIAQLNEEIQQVKDQIQATASDVFSVIDDAEERLAVTTDKDERVISYRDKDGVLHEKKGVDTSKYYLNGEEKDFVDKSEVAGIAGEAIDDAISNGDISLEDINGVSNHNTPNLLIADEMQKTFNDGTNSFTPPNEGYEMSNPIECQAGDWFTRTGTATGMVVVTDENDKNGTRLFNAEGGTLGNTFQVPTDMTWIRYIRMAALKTGANDGSVVICKGKVAYTGDEKGDFLTLDKVRIQKNNLPKDIRYLKSEDGKYWELYVDESHNLQIREIDPEIITNLPNDFPIITFSGDFNNLFEYICVGVGSKYNFVINKNGVVKYIQVSKTGTINSGYGNFERVKTLSGENRYVFGLSTNETNSTHVPEIGIGITICDEDLNIIETGITSGTGWPDIHDEIFIDDDHLILFRYGSKNVELDGFDEPVRIQGVVIEEIKKIDGEWTVIGSFDTGDYPQLCTDCFGDFTDPENDVSVMDAHPNTLDFDYDGNIILNCRNWDTWIKIRRVENEDGTVTIGSKTLDYDEAIIGRVGGRHNSGYLDSKRVLNDGFSFTDAPASLTEVSDDDWEEWQWFHCHDVKYWGMKTIGDKQYPTYTIFDNNMWSRNEFVTGRYNTSNKHNNISINPEQDNEEYNFSRYIQLSIDWENHLIKDYKIYFIPNVYKDQAGGMTMYEEGVFLLTWPSAIKLNDFTTEETQVSGQLYKGAKTLFEVNTSSYRPNAY